MAFAEGTTVAVEKTRGEVDDVSTMEPSAVRTLHAVLNARTPEPTT